MKKHLPAVILTLIFLNGVAPSFAGTVLTANLPLNTAIININATQDGAASYNGDQSLWYQPFSYGTLPQFTVPAGSYYFRVVNPADAAQLFPALTTAQTNQIYTAWTFNSPWLEDYLVFDSAAANNSSIPQLFDGAPPASFFGNAIEAYNDALTNTYYNGNSGTNGYYNILRTGPLGRASTIFTNRYTFTHAVTLLFVIPDYGLYDNQGGASVLISPAGISTTNLLINPGAETGDLTAWSVDGSATVDNGVFDGGILPHTGNYDFVGYSGSAASLSQVVALVGNQGITAPSIDGGSLIAGISFWEQGLDQGATSDDAYISVAFWDSSSNVISTVSAPEIDSHNLTWSNYVSSYPIPANTRYLQYTMHFTRHVGSDLDSFVDDNSLTVFDTMAIPKLVITPAPAGQSVISWTPNTPGFVLQESAGLSPAAWTYSDSGATNPVIISTSSSSKFYRLSNP